MEEINEEQYIQGFQEGYLIASKSPDLAKELSKTKLSNDRGKGMLAGFYQHEADKNHDASITKSYLDKLPSQSKTQEKDKGLDKD